MYICIYIYIYKIIYIYIVIFSVVVGSMAHTVLGWVHKIMKTVDYSVIELGIQSCKMPPLNNKNRLIIEMIDLLDLLTHFILDRDQVYYSHKDTSNKHVNNK